VKIRFFRQGTASCVLVDMPNLAPTRRGEAVAPAMLSGKWGWVKTYIFTYELRYFGE